MKEDEEEVTLYRKIKKYKKKHILHPCLLLVYNVEAKKKEMFHPEDGN